MSWPQVKRAKKARIAAFKTITPADAQELCHMLGLSVEMRIQKSKAKKSDLLQEWETRPDSLDLEGFLLLSGPLLGLPLPALRAVPDEEESPLCLEEMLQYPDAEAIFKRLALDEDGCLPSKVLAAELTTPSSEVAMFFAERAIECAQPMKSRTKLVRLLTWRIERDDALGTLFFTFLLLLVLYFLVQENLMIHSRQKAESGVAQYISAFGGSLNGPFLHEHVADVNSFWSWTFNSGLPAILGMPVVDGMGLTRLHVAGSNVLLGDVMLSHTAQDGAEESRWLLHTDAARSYLANRTGDFLGAARSAVDLLRRTSADWNDPYSEEIALQFSLHNAPASMFLNVQVRSRFFRTGDVDVRIQSSACMDNAEVTPVQAALDIFLVALISWLAIAEAKEAFATLMHGCRAFTSYVGFWNAVDWACIGLAIVTACVWVLTGTRIGSDNLQFVREADFDPMAPSEEQLSVMQEELLNIQHWLLSVRVLTCLLTLTVILKFFKGFRANPRLQIVADALMNSANNIAHFFMIFWTLFSCFAVIAHVLFGNDIVEFASLANSLEASMSTLMGEFEWYVRASGVKSGLMNSGMPIIAVHLWFVVYICFALLVLFNMLLAMVLDSYAAAAQVLTKRADAPTIVTQTFRYFQRWKETLRFVPLRHLAIELHDLDCHRQKVVTTTSLQEAFPQMKRNQAEWLMRTLFQEDKRAKATQKALEGHDQRSSFLSQEGPDPSQIAAACLPAFKAASEASAAELLARLALLESKVDTFYGQKMGLLKEKTYDSTGPVATEVDSGTGKRQLRSTVGLQDAALCCAVAADARLSV